MRLHTAICSLAALAPLASVLGCSTDEPAVFGRALTWQQEPGTEIQDCYVFKLDNEEAIEVDRIAIDFPTGSHHVHIYRSDQPEPEDGVTDCWGQAVDWSRWQLVVGAQTQAMDWQLPEGLTVPLEPHQQLLVQVHWLNTEDVPIDGRIDIEFQRAQRPGQHLGVLFGIQKQVAMQPHEEKVVSARCPMPADASVLAIMGHFHGLGRRYEVQVVDDQGSPPESLYRGADEQTLFFEQYDPPRAVAAGQHLEYICDYLNYRDVAIDWSADTKTGEHCNMVAYYFPAAQPATYCITEKPEVLALEPSRDAIAGEEIEIAVQLSEPAGAGGADIDIAVADPSMLEAPAAVHVPEGETTAAFRARALRPARAARLTARLGSSQRDLDLAIGGLVLSEVLPGKVSGEQWIEIANLSRVPIDLSGYSLGAGSDDYTATRVQLATQVPPLGCVLVGGPDRAAAGGADPAPYDQMVDFTPDLGRGGDVADGVALFDAPADRVTGDALPLDALVYGVDNEGALPDPSGQPAAPVPAPRPGLSLMRQSPTSWSEQAAVTPGICEVAR
jgi:hypothetical protein